MIQNVQTVRAGLPCRVNVMNHSGDDLLTTYDPANAATCVEAAETIEAFWSRCIDEHHVTPTIFGRAVGGETFDLIQFDDKPNLDPGLFEEILIQPVPLTGG
jgi:hypothetical protein